MAVAFVLINVEAGKEREIVEKLSKMKEVKEVYLLYGEYDAIAKVFFDTLEELNKFVLEKIRKIPGVKLTSTMLAI